MELRSFALNVIQANTLEGKLQAPPAVLSDAVPGSAEVVTEPGRPPSLPIERVRKVKVPRLAGMPDPKQRRRILHALANHELQAVELFAWALLAFPEMPTAFRRGCLKVLTDEQRHLSLYMHRIEALGGSFGEEPVTGHFWNKVPAMGTPLRFVCTMGLTFENANLDFCQEHIEAARAAGDEATADVLAQVHQDEIAHVRFAWTWLLRLKPPEQSAWEAFVANVTPPHGPERARGRTFDRQARVDAGIEAAFISALETVQPTRPGGAPR